MGTANGKDPPAFKSALLAFFGVLTASLTLGLLLAAAEALGFSPLITVNRMNEHILQHLAQPLRNPPDVPFTAPVVFIDIDEKTLEGFLRDTCAASAAKSGKAAGSSATDTTSSCVPARGEDFYNWGRATPRGLVAEVLATVSALDPAAIFLDLDLREPEPTLFPASGYGGDEALREELTSRDHIAPVLIPRILDHREFDGPCQLKDGRGDLPRAFPTIVDSVSRSTGGASAASAQSPPPGSAVARPGSASPSRSIQFVHGYFSADGLGYVDGVCSTLLRRAATDDGAPVPISSAAHAALQLGPNLAAGIDFPATFRPVQFRVNTEASLTSISGKLLYQRIPANLLLKPFSFCAEARNCEKLKYAIVIVGATHPGSGDLHRTALGMMPGALVHANIVLELQLGPAKRPSRWLELVAELVIAMTLAFLFASVHVYWGIRLAQKHSAGSFSRASIRLRMFALMILLSAGVAFAYYALVLPRAFSDASEFLVLAPLLTFAAEVVFEVAHNARWLTESVMERILPREKD